MNDQTKFPCIPPTKPEFFVQVLSEVEDYNLKLMNIPEMWKRTKGKGVRVAVLDTGTPTHDDVPVKGKFSAVPNYLYDENGHGTAVASMIGAIAGNGMGIAGIAPECELYTCAVLDKNGTGSSEWIAAGIRWAVDVAQAHIINMSLGMPGYPISQRIKDACQYAHDKGVTLIAASGNEHGAVCQPGIYDTVISVGAVDKDKKPADFSNMGEQLDFVAGGVSCYMAYLHNGYAKQSGTSFASPAIAGLAALIISDALNANPPRVLTPAEVQEGIQKISMDLGTVGRDVQTGYGVPIFGYTNPAFNIPQLPPPSPEATLKESSLSLATRANDLASKLSNPAAVSETLLFLSGELKAAAEAIVKKEQP